MDIDAELSIAADAIHKAARAKPNETRAEAIARACNAVKAKKKLAAAARATAADMIAGRKISAEVTDGDQLIPGDQAAVVTAGQLDETIVAISKVLNDRFADMGQRIDELRKENAELKAKPSMKYEGVFDPLKVYAVGNFITDDGSLWCCMDACVGVRPGSPGGTWQLAVKRGRDAKDLRR